MKQTSFPRRNSILRKLLIAGVVFGSVILVAVIFFVEPAPEFVEPSDDGLHETNYHVQDRQQYFEIGQYEFWVLPSNHNWMTDVLGFVWLNDDTEIYLRGGMEVTDFYDTCVHEVLHNLGIPGGDGYEHDWISDKQDEIVEEHCLELLTQVKTEPASPTDPEPIPDEEQPDDLESENVDQIHKY